MITKSKAQDWRTPGTLFAGLHARERFTRDCFASIGNHLLPRYWTAAHNTFKKRLDDGEHGFGNPPFGLIREALEWGFAQRAHAWTTFLLPHNGETAWFREVAVYGSKKCFNRRVEYVAPRNVETSSPSFASMLVKFGPGVRSSGLGFTHILDADTGEVVARHEDFLTPDVITGTEYGGSARNIVEEKIALAPTPIARFTLNYDPKFHAKKINPSPQLETHCAECGGLTRQNPGHQIACSWNLFNSHGNAKIGAHVDADSFRVPNAYVLDPDDIPF